MGFTAMSLPEDACTSVHMCERAYVFVYTCGTCICFFSCCQPQVAERLFRNLPETVVRILQCFSESNQSLISETTINYFLNQKGPPLTYSFLDMTDLTTTTTKPQWSPGFPDMNFELDTQRKIFSEYF